MKDFPLNPPNINFNPPISGADATDDFWKVRNSYCWAYFAQLLSPKPTSTYPTGLVVGITIDSPTTTTTTTLSRLSCDRHLNLENSV